MFIRGRAFSSKYYLPHIQVQSGRVKWRADPREKKNVILPIKPYIRRYNWSNKDWIPISTLGDKTLLFSEKNSQVATIGKDDIMI